MKVTDLMRRMTMTPTRTTLTTAIPMTTPVISPSVRPPSVKICTIYYHELTLNFLNSELVNSCSLRIGNGDVVDSPRVLHLELADLEQGHVLIGFSGGLDTVTLKRVFSRIIN